MNAVVGGLIALAVLILLAVVAVLLVERRRSGRQTPAERYRRDVANLQYKPQTWKTKRAAATRAQKHKLWAAGAAGAAGGYVVGTSGTGGRRKWLWRRRLRWWRLRRGRRRLRGLLSRLSRRPPSAVYSPVKFGARFSNIAVMPSVRSLDGRNAEFHAAT